MRTSWSPIRDILQLHARLGRALGEPIVRTWGEATGQENPMPRLDFAEVAEAFVIRVDLPGVERSDVEVSTADGNLEIKGLIPALSADEEGARIHRAERPNGPFRRIVPLPRQADVESISASMSEGVLTIRIAKRASDRGRTIPVE